jgi:multidrug resistance efflux pump
MRFKRSGFRPYDRDGMISVNLNKPRRRLWRRSRIVLFAIGAALIASIAVDRAWLRGNGIVAGELTAVAPIVNARLKRLVVHCLDRVIKGQRLAEFENEATAESAAQQLQRLQLGLIQARAQIEIAASEAQAARKLVDAEAALLQQQIAVLKAEDELVKKNYVAVLAWEQAKSAVARADAETRAAEFVYQTKKADQKKAELDAAALKEQIASFNASPELTGHFYLTAPTDGIITECAAQPGDVIPAKTPIFQIFNPNKTYAVVFFDPADLPKLALGQSFAIDISGVDKSVTGIVTGFYPELSALPQSLTRYFWQQEMWSQYVPVRLDFAAPTAAQRSRIFAWAQLSASRLQTGALVAWAAHPWRWMRRSVAVAWGHGAAGPAQREGDP